MNCKIQRFYAAVLFLGLLPFLGCATQGELETVQRDTTNTTKEILALQRNIYDLNGELKNLSTKLDALAKRNDQIQREIAALGNENKAKMGYLEKELETSSQPMRRYQAELGSRLDKLQMDVQNLTGRFEESKYFAQKTYGETKNLKESYQGRLDDLEKRLVALNKNLEGWEKRLEAQEREKEKEPRTLKLPEEGEESKTPSATRGEATKVQPPNGKKTEKKPIASPDEAYQRAYDLFTKGNVEAAKEDFKRFLEVYPKSKYAENAHYWLGECYFADKKYEEAILEFDEVIKKYSKGNKVPDALFRQGMAFLEMNDSTNAKLILKEVIKRYPKSDQASRARKKLKELG